MTTRIGFYHLVPLPLEQALPKLLEKAMAAGNRVLVMAGSVERVAYLDNLLWTYQPDSWLAHGTMAQPDQALQPVLLTDRDENANGADLLILTDGVQTEHIASFSRCLNIFDGNDDAAVEAARAQWKDWKNLGLELVYYQQTDRGGWVEKARVGGPSETPPSPAP